MVGTKQVHQDSKRKQVAQSQENNSRSSKNGHFIQRGNHQGWGSTLLFVTTDEPGEETIIPEKAGCMEKVTIQDLELRPVCLSPTRRG